MQVNALPYIVDISRTESSKGAGTAAPATAGKAAAALRGPDRVELSGAFDLQKLKGELAALPDLRLDRVALAKQKLQQGGYQLDGKVLAQKMMESLGQG